MRFANQTIKALNLGEAIHKARKMSERNSIPSKFLILPTYNKPTTKEQILQIPELSKTMRAVEIAKLFKVKPNAVYHYANILSQRGTPITFVRGKPGVKPKI